MQALLAAVKTPATFYAVIAEQSYKFCARMYLYFIRKYEAKGA